MELQEAIHQMDTGDAFLPNEGELVTMKKGRDGILRNIADCPIPMHSDTLKLQGRIIPAEPEILTAEELIEKYGGPCKRTQSCGYHDALRISQASDLNGQRKYYKHVEPLIERVKEYIAVTITSLPYSKLFKEALEKIEKPE